MKFTLGQAAKETGLAKSTLSRDIKSGKISATRLVNGSYEIDASELFRVYDRVTPETGSGNTSSNDQQPLNSPSGTVGLQSEVQRLREMVEAFGIERERERSQLEDQIRDLRRRLDVEGEERRGLMRLVTDQRPAAPTPAPIEESSRKGFWSMFGRKTG